MAGYSVEDRLTMSCVRYFKLQYGQYKKRIFHVPNERKMKVQKAAKLKKMGVLAGVSDLIIMVAKGKYHGLAIELKPAKWKNGKMRRDKYPSESQRDFLCEMNQGGYAVAVCWTVDEFKTTVDTYMEGEEVHNEYLISNGHLEAI